MGSSQKDREERVGICLSGGGIRSASFALGALQALQDKDQQNSASELARADYITAVSGGSYTAGAFALAVHGKKGKTEQEHEQPIDNLKYDEVFTPGSPEFDYLRRHSSYIADGLREWAVAIFVAVRGGLLSTLILGSMAMTAGLWNGHLYQVTRRWSDLNDPWHPAWGPIFVTCCVAGLGLLFWLMSAGVSFYPKVRGVLAEIAKMTWLAVAVLATLGAGIPIITWASMRAFNLSGGMGSSAGAFALAAAKGGALGVLGALMTIVGLLTRQRTRVLNAARSAAGKLNQQLGDIGKRSVEWLCVYTGLAIVVAVYLVIFGYSTHLAANADPNQHPLVQWGVPSWRLPLTNYQATAYLTILLIVLYLLVDEMVLGLHPFYRRRLARAFAVRRTQPDMSGHANGSKRYGAKGYDRYERTPLDESGGSSKSSPQVIFCAAAHCSDPDETPPGRHVLPFVLSHDYVGGPEIEWYPTEKLFALARSKRLKADLTIENAMAVSGAAFASATGSHQSAANLILALANARLGAWLPNPRLLKEIDEHPKRWWRPRPPRIRRMSYLVREIFGWYPVDLPLVFVVDGGQYENLGLIELLRHRCTEIYCFDATSDTQTFGDSLAKSITLAATELGVEITLNKPERADPRNNSRLTDSTDLRGRIAETPIITANLTYPACIPGGQLDGFLVIGRTTLDEETPWEIRRHAASHPLFPHDATGDQWFDDCKFNAYTGLGRYVGNLARAAMQRHNDAALPNCYGRKQSQTPAA